MNRLRLTLLSLALGAATFIVTGCGERDFENDSTGLYAKNNQGYNLMGFVDYSPESYNRLSNTSDVVHSSELTKRKNVSGDNVTFLWGAFTYADY